MRETPLDRPRDIYRPFSRSESDVLRGFVGSVRRLRERRLFEQIPSSVTMFAKSGRAAIDEPDEEAATAAIALFRQVYTPTEPHSFRRAMNLLKSSVSERNGPLREDALHDLRDHVAAENKVLASGIGIGMVLNERAVTSRDIIDAYFHGQVLHSGNPKSDLARQLDTMAVPRLALFRIMFRLLTVYWYAANATDRLLATPELLDAEKPAP